MLTLELEVILLLVYSRHLVPTTVLLPHGLERAVVPITYYLMDLIVEILPLVDLKVLMLPLEHNRDIVVFCNLLLAKCVH